MAYSRYGFGDFNLISRKKNGESVISLAKEYEVSETAIRKAMAGESWGHINRQKEKSKNIDTSKET